MGVVLDLVNCIPPVMHLVDVMTRATTSLHFVINESKEPMFIGNLQAYRFLLTGRKKVEEIYERLIVEATNSQLHATAPDGTAPDGIAPDGKVLNRKKKVMIDDRS